MTLISGIPPWMQMYFDRLIEKSGKKVGELFPQFSVMVQGGVNFEPYKSKLYDDRSQLGSARIKIISHKPKLPG